MVRSDLLLLLSKNWRFAGSKHILMSKIMLSKERNTPFFAKSSIFTANPLFTLFSCSHWNHQGLNGPSNQLTDLSVLLFWCVWSGSLNSWLLGGFWPDVGCIAMQVSTKMWFKCLVTYLLILLIILLNSLPVGHTMSFKTISYDLYVDDILLYRSVNPNWIMVS